MSKCTIYEYYIISIYFQAAERPVLAVSVLYFEKKTGIGCVNILKIRQSDTYQIVFLMRNQGHLNSSQFQSNQTLPPPAPMVHSALLILGNF